MGGEAGQYLQSRQGPAVGVHVHIPLEPGCYMGSRNGIPMGFSEFVNWGQFDPLRLPPTSPGPLLADLPLSPQMKARPTSSE